MAKKAKGKSKLPKLTKKLKSQKLAPPPIGGKKPVSKTFVIAAVSIAAVIVISLFLFLNSALVGRGFYQIAVEDTSLSKVQDIQVVQEAQVIEPIVEETPPDPPVPGEELIIAQVDQNLIEQVVVPLEEQEMTVKSGDVQNVPQLGYISPELFEVDLDAMKVELVEKSVSADEALIYVYLTTFSTNEFIGSVSLVFRVLPTGFFNYAPGMNFHTDVQTAYGFDNVAMLTTTDGWGHLHTFSSTPVKVTPGTRRLFATIKLKQTSQDPMGFNRDIKLFEQGPGQWKTFSNQGEGQPAYNVKMNDFSFCVPQYDTCPQELNCGVIDNFCGVALQCGQACSQGASCIDNVCGTIACETPACTSATLLPPGAEPKDTDLLDGIAATFVTGSACTIDADCNPGDFCNANSQCEFTKLKRLAGMINAVKAWLALS
jgi:hypothetical protein